MNTKVIGLRRLAFGVTALAVSAAATLPALSGAVSAAQLDVRSIRMSSSAASGTNVIYRVGFTVANAATDIGGIAIDFCSNTPIIGDSTCTAPTGFDSNDAALTVANESNISGLAVDATSSTANSVRLTRTPGAPTAAAISFELGNGTTTGFTNPSTVSSSGNQGTFYARIHTYTTGAGATGHSTTAPTGYTDAGGIALSTASQVTITAKVQETLTFCVYTAATCATPGTLAVNLGDTNGVLSTAGPFVDITTNFDIATNAASGAIVRMKSTLPTSGGNTLASIGATATASSAGTTQFGLCGYASSGTGLTFAAPYDDTNCDTQTSQTAGTGSTGGAGTALFAFDTTSACTTGDENVTCTYGDQLATKTAGNASQGEIAFIGNVSPTQAAGIYTNTVNLIATGTY